MLLDYTKTATLVSRHPPHEIARRLTVETTTTTWYNIFTMQQFEGVVYADGGFQIRQTGRSQLSIRGSIRPLASGISQIDLVIKNRTSNKISRACFLLISGIFILAMLSFTWHDGFSFYLLLFLLPVLMTALMHLSANMEYDRILIALREILKAKNAG